MEKGKTQIRYYLAPAVVFALAVGFMLWSRTPAKVPLRIETAEHSYNLLVDIAATPKEREKGLMGRAFLPEDEGMLLVYEHPGTPVLWMKNMVFPLDFVFIGSDQSVVEIKSKIPPCGTADDLCPRYFPNHPARYVLELAGGFVEKYGIHLGDKISLEK
ncbi:DUF192 domain-containing protein [Candidatus Peregrinibacteria bacterium]|nr:DUF192 domain-containing protein [Candidatus Peregrinibacteria bacterium]